MRNYNIHRGAFFLMLVVFIFGGHTALKAQTPNKNKFSRQEKQILVQRNFPLIVWIQEHPGLSRLIKKDPTLSAVSREQKMNLSKALKLSSDATERIIQSSLLWDSMQVKRIGHALVGIYQRKPKHMKRMIQGLKASHVYALWDTKSDTSFLRKAWESVANGLNYIQRTYFLGGKPTYGKIDGITIHLEANSIKSRITDLLQADLQKSGKIPFYQIRLDAALLALELNERDEAARYMPLQGGINSTAFSKVKTIVFKDFTYSCILVPGLGPEKEGERLTPGGKERCRMALAYFKKGVAPFLLVSGGHVHPIKTPFCEALEMKHFMVDSLGMAADRIIIDPHARHTTTNLRNATRIIRLFGMPFDQPVLIVTDQAQSAYINNGMRKTSIRDLGYLPYQHLKVLSPTKTSFVPNIQSLQVNPLDPLDP